jgi:hypothetical protein
MKGENKGVHDVKNVSKRTMLNVVASTFVDYVGKTYKNISTHVSLLLVLTTSLGVPTNC